MSLRVLEMYFAHLIDLVSLADVLKMIFRQDLLDVILLYIYFNRNSMALQLKLK